MSDAIGADTAPDDEHGTMEAWGIIANAYDGNWSDAPAEWREAAERWRDRWLHRTPDAPWREGDLPDIRLADRAELHVAGALSTMPPFDKYHPAEALPFAVMALKALGNLDLSDEGDTSG